MGYNGLLKKGTGSEPAGANAAEDGGREVPVPLFPTKAEDLATGDKFDLPKQWSLVLGPYDLRSIAVPADVEISGFTATPPEEIVKNLRQEAEQVLALFGKLRTAGKSVPGMDKLEERMRAALAEGKLAWLRRALSSYVVRKSRAIGG